MARHLPSTLQLLILEDELGLAARGMKTRRALLFYATRLYAKLRRKLQPQEARPPKAPRSSCSAASPSPK